MIADTNNESGISDLSVFEWNDQYYVDGFGPKVALTLSGERAMGTGATLFGVPDHDIVLSLTGEKLLLDASHSNGGKWSAYFFRQ